MTETRKAAIASARTLFLKRGLEATRIEDVRDDSGISTGSLYHHFGSKQGLLEAVVIDALADHKAHLMVALQAEIATGKLGPKAPAENNAEAAIKAVIGSTATWITQNPDAARVIFRFRGALESAGSSALKSHNRHELAPLIKRVQDWIDQRQIKNFPIALLMPLMLGPLHEYARSWLAGRTDQPPTKHIEVFFAAAWAALRP
jgi:AcrR family transcriptional regulator